MDSEIAKGNFLLNSIVAFRFAGTVLEGDYSIHLCVLIPLRHCCSVVFLHLSQKLTMLSTNLTQFWHTECGNP